MRFSAHAVPAVDRRADENPVMEVVDNYGNDLSERGDLINKRWLKYDDSSLISVYTCNFVMFTAYVAGIRNRNTTRSVLLPRQGHELPGRTRASFTFQQLSFFCRLNLAEDTRSGSSYPQSAKVCFFNGVDVSNHEHQPLLKEFGLTSFMKVAIGINEIGLCSNINIPSA